MESGASDVLPPEQVLQLRSLPMDGAIAFWAAFEGAARELLQRLPAAKEPERIERVIEQIEHSGETGEPGTK